MSFSYRGGVLCAEQVPLDSIAERFGTPCYVYSRAAIESAYAEFARALESRPALVCYSVKANSNLAVLALLAQLGAGFDIVSGGELLRVLAARSGQILNIASTASASGTILSQSRKTKKATTGEMKMRDRRLSSARPPDQILPANWPRNFATSPTTDPATMASNDGG